MLQFSDLTVLLAIILIAWFWWHAQAARQNALAACREHCQQQDLQLLDETVSLTKLWLKRDLHGRLRWWRLYTFEFTASGADRFRGSLEMIGGRPLLISLGNYRMH